MQNKPNQNNIVVGTRALKRDRPVSYSWIRSSYVRLDEFSNLQCLYFLICKTETIAGFERLRHANTAHHKHSVTVSHCNSTKLNGAKEQVISIYIKKKTQFTQSWFTSWHYPVSGYTQGRELDLLSVNCELRSERSWQWMCWESDQAKRPEEMEHSPAVL